MRTKYMTEWSIQARSHQCQSCNRPFKNNEQMHTLLFDERQAYHRIDVCEDCWAAQHAEGSTQRKGFVSHWISTYSPPQTQPPEPIQRETAEGLLRKLVELRQEQYVAPCFILAVMLERRRILKARSQAIEAGRRVIVYEHSRTGEVFTIADPDLRLDQLEEVQREVARLLEHGPSQPGSEPAGISQPAVGSAPPSAHVNEPPPPFTSMGNTGGPDATSSAQVQQPVPSAEPGSEGLSADV